MLRSLWTAASGMKSQQVNVDTIANNLANINTTGYKTERVEFQSLLYQTIQKKSYDSEGDPKPIPAQVGLGVKSGAITSNFSQGIYTDTGNTFDFAIDGKGFFQVELPDGSIGYTRNGALKMSIGSDGLTLTNAEGYQVLSTAGEPVVLPETYDSSRITVDKYGNLWYPDADGNAQMVGIQIELVQFNNPAGLTKTSESIFKQSDASGEPRYESQDTDLKKSIVQQGYLEGSNVSAADEMVNLIIAQRAYEMNSKAITASDEMLQQANNLRG
ncbi:MAG: flagellar basal-body rod protein FlgG [Lachnospiraceae bacterium]|jgi:flagellar basal-body rod protein FlgG|nr:flagellar basal-body rod protein FlgG [Lachnospiraceae bacterium]MCR4803226.1 flagellar basal-body rod protein FlgG [Lachnospiraceae bacterium]